MVEHLVAEVVRRYRDLVTREDLLGAGVIALHEAALAYHEDGHPSFPHYARHHVHGRLLDAVRKDHFKLSGRVEHAMARAFSRMLSHLSLDIDLFRDEEEKLVEGARRGCADVLAGAVLAGSLEAQRGSSEEEIVERGEHRLAYEALKEAMGALRPHEREVIELVYQRGMTMDEVAREVGVHAHTAQRRHVSALRRLRARLEERGVMRPPPVVDEEVPP